MLWTTGSEMTAKTKSANVSMRGYALIFCAAAFGAACGYFGAARVASVNAAGPDRTEVHELVLLDEKGRTAARLFSQNGRTTLSFYTKGDSLALELGVGIEPSVKFLHFFGADGRTIATLNSGPPYGETTLTLGDDRWETRMIIGALRPDTEPRGDGIDEWGAQIRRPGSRVPIFSVVSRPLGQDAMWAAGLHMLLPSGRIWEPR
jgi:hypothetical protein